MSTAKRYYWENDYLNNEDVIETLTKDVEEKPKGSYLKKLAFSDTLIVPIVDTIQTHIDAKHVIGICGDYDVDGTAATTILYKTISELKGVVCFEIPNRFIDGYGLSIRLVDLFIEQGVKLLITVDNGIAAVEAIAYAKTKGLTVIVTDHHTVGETLPDADYILHPELDETISQKEICGAMVAYLLAIKILDKYKKIKEKNISKEDVLNLTAILQQLACMATIADMMPLKEANRDITYLGFKLIKNEGIPFLKAFKQVSSAEQITSDFLTFQVHPTINAVGRLADSNEVVQALLADSVAEAKTYIQGFLELNDQRKTLTNTIYAEVMESYTVTEDEGFFLAVGENWHQGVLGIVAQKVMQQIGRPTIILTNSATDATIYTGSARAFSGYNVYTCFQALSTHLEKYGGHQYAGGMTVTETQLSDFQKALTDYNEEQTHKLTEIDKKMHLTIDGWQQFKALNMSFLKYQEAFEPFGEENKAFTIGIKQVRLLTIQELGKTQQHLKLTVEEAGQKYQVVAFGFYHLLDKLALYSTLDLVISVQKNQFNGQINVQYLLIDLRTPKKQIYDYRNIKYQAALIENEQTSYVLKDIPLELDAFYSEINAPKIERIYIQKIKYEDLFVYENTIPQTAFSYVYKVIAKQKELDLKSDALYQAFYTQKLPKSVVLYIINVFFELDFVIIEEYICKINEQNQKQPLSDSAAYQKMDEWFKLRNLLLFESVDKMYEQLALKSNPVHTDGNK